MNTMNAPAAPEVCQKLPDGSGSDKSPGDFPADKCAAHFPDETLRRYSAMIARSQSNALPKIPRFVTEDGLGRETDDANAAVRGAASILENCTNAELRRRATNELAHIAHEYRGRVAVSAQRGHFAAKVSDPPTMPAQREQPGTLRGEVSALPVMAKTYKGNRARALAAVRGLPGYGNTPHAEPTEPTEGGLF